MRCLPTSYVEAMARQKSMQPGSKSFEEWMEQLTHMYNLDVGIIPGFFKWLGQMLTFKFGDSWLWTKPVTEVFNNCVWISFFMGLIAFVLQIIIAIPWASLPPPSSTARQTMSFRCWLWPVFRCPPSSLLLC